MDKVYLQRTAHKHTLCDSLTKSDANCERNHWRRNEICESGEIYFQ